MQLGISLHTDTYHIDCCKVSLIVGYSSMRSSDIHSRCLIIHSAEILHINGFINNCENVTNTVSILHNATHATKWGIALSQILTGNKCLFGDALQLLCSEIGLVNTDGSYIEILVLVKCTYKILSLS